MEYCVAADFLRGDDLGLILVSAGVMFLVLSLSQFFSGKARQNRPPTEFSVEECREIAAYVDLVVGEETAAIGKLQKAAERAIPAMVKLRKAAAEMASHTDV